jgi:proteasome lid subunit RPN8/RPN11
MDSEFDNMLRQIKELAQASPRVETGGFVVEKNNKLIVVPLINEAPRDSQPDTFVLGGMQYLQCLAMGNPKYFFHSHVDYDETPSTFDEQACDHFGLPFLIYSLKTDKTTILSPKDE